MELKRLNQNTLREIVERVITEVINESAVDREFHYTTLERFLSIIANDELLLKDWECDDGQYSLSLTRTRTNQHGYQYSTFTWSNDRNYVRIEFDGRMLETIRNAKIKPFDYLSDQGEPRNGKQEHRSDYEQGFRYKHDYPQSINRQFWAQSEDRMILRNNKIKNPLRYITRVDVMIKNRWNKDYKVFKKLLRQYPLWKKVIHLHKDDKSFNMPSGT